ncbi:hypothetical protein RBB79_03645 [Tunturiibacter empetritectus]|uniref:DUF1761 domain-containing protein n=2 Tax=Tunturiibacter TaxID=3154218 RepID=A0A852VB06_9BACT|nr:hypothetical protein [Edaphobacter lichenicola]NYF88607.1 hypothetical protein [Edaphobacter lichenicola]
MITGAFLLVAIVLGYLLTVGLSMAATFSIARFLPDLVARDHRITSTYKLLQDGVWLVCTAVGGFAAALVLGTDHSPWIGSLSLMAVLMGVLWTNTWEMRQRGVGHQMLMSLATVAGVGAGFFLRLR